MGHLKSRPDVLRPEALRPEALRPEAPRQPAARPAENRESAFARFAERYGASKTGPSPTALAEAAARNDLILEDDEAPTLRAAPVTRLPPAAAARMERLQALARPRPAPAKPADEDLFEAPRRAAGGLR